MKNTTNKRWRIVYGDGTLGVHDEQATYLFSYEKGGLESLRVQNQEWVYRVPKPAFWRATTDNDRGNGFSHRVAQWLGADQFSALATWQVTIDGQGLVEQPIAPFNNRYDNQQYADEVIVAFTFVTPTVPQTTVTMTYHLTPTGTLQLTAHYYGQPNLPELPAFGIRLIVPEQLSGYQYEGLSGETYPDRWHGAQAGTFTVAGVPITPYLVPQEMGMRMQTNWVTLQTNQMAKLQIAQQQQPFAFSILPYTAIELEAATHQNELPPARRSVVSLFGAVRGVGGIDSWGSDVQPAYRLPADQDYEVAVTLTPIIE